MNAIRGTEADVKKATALREKALKRMPGIKKLMERPDLEEASWWLSNIRRLHTPKVWVDLVDDIKDKNDLRADIYEIPHEDRMANYAKVQERMLKLYGNTRHNPGTASDPKAWITGWHGDDEKFNKF